MTNDTLLDQVQDHFKEADKYIDTVRSDWDDLEAMLVCKLTDSLSTTTNSRVFDPILSTIVYERVSRVMAQSPKGKAYAQSKDDLGKNALMNLILKFYYKNANEQEKMLIKLRLMDLYSLVYGSMFGIVPWRNQKNGYTGGEFNVLPIRDCFPQPTKTHVSDMDWFVVRNVVSASWLEKQDGDVWNMDEVTALINEMKNGGDETQNTDAKRKSMTQKESYPSTYTDVAFPQVELLTEYRGDSWITWSPRRISSKTSKPRILRKLDEPYPDGKLPIVVKHAFPLMDSPIGFGEFARGMSLQMGINSLWNLYLQGVKYSIYPPLHINPNNVVQESVKWGEGEFWFMQNPNSDIQPMRMSPAGLETFNSTFGAMKAAIESQAGTTSIRESAHTQSTLGKTPQAIQFMSERENARDEWDRVMMEDTISQIYERWIGLTIKNMSGKMQIRLFGDEIEDIKQMYPDVVEMYDSGKRGVASITKDQIDSTYDFVLETGSTTKVDIEDEQNNITSVLKAVLENPQLIEALQAEGKTINLGELFKRWVMAGNIKDYDKIITDIPQEQPEEQMTLGLNPEDYSDPDIQSAVSQLMGGIPQQNVR